MAIICQGQSPLSHSTAAATKLCSSRLHNHAQQGNRH